VTKEQLASLASSLKDNEVFQKVLDNIKADAIEVLCSVDADDKNTLLKAQAMVNVVDAIRETLALNIREGEPKAAPGIA